MSESRATPVELVRSLSPVFDDAEFLSEFTRNITVLMRDDLLDRMHAVLDRINEEVTYLVASGPSDIASRFDPERKQHVRVSKSLRESLRGQK